MIREETNTARGVDICTMELPSNDEVGHHVRRVLGETVATHPRRDPVPQCFEGVSEYLRAAKGVFGGELHVMPRRGGIFLSRCWPDFHVFDDTDTLSDRHRLLEELIYDFNSLLRHKIGLFSFNLGFRGNRSFPTIECDEGGWVNIDTILERDLFRQPKKATAQDNTGEKCRRLTMLLLSY